jgi:hypothetical protein
MRFMRQHDAYAAGPPAAVGQYEAGVVRPRPDLAEVLEVPVAFFAAGRPNAQLDASGTQFRSLRSTRVFQRDKAVAFASQIWELTPPEESHWG